MLDAATVARVIQVDTDQAGDCRLYQEQLARWAGGTLTPAQRREVTRLGEQLGRLRAVNAAILARVPALYMLNTGVLVLILVVVVDSFRGG